MRSTTRQQIQESLQPTNYQLHPVTRSAEAQGPRISLVSAKAAEQPSSTRLVQQLRPGPDGIRLVKFWWQRASLCPNLLTKHQFISQRPESTQ
eukprot:s2097_g9.t1